MFTGIITNIGEVVALEKRGDLCATLAYESAMGEPAIGASIACAGVCLTVTAWDTQTFRCDISGETLRATTLGSWEVGTRVNLEAALKVGDALGGHFVTGHVDGVATVTRITPEGESHQLTISASPDLMRYIAPKGSVALDGVSLTVNAVRQGDFTVNIIPHTWGHTTLRNLREGSTLNLEIDLLARYVARMAKDWT